MEQMQLIFQNTPALKDDGIIDPSTVADFRSVQNWMAQTNANMAEIAPRFTTQ